MLKTFATTLRLTLKTLVGVWCVLTMGGSALAVTNPLDSTADLSPLTLQQYLNGVLTFSASAGTGTPATGGLVFSDPAPNGVSEHTGIVYANAAIDATANGVFETSVMVNFKEFQTVTGNKEKGEVRIGFTTSTTVNASKPGEFLNKTNPCVSVRLTAEHQQGSTDRKVETEVVSFTTIEEKPAALRKTVNGAAYFQNWLRVTLIATKTGASTFAVAIRVEDCGADGTATPTVIPELTAGPATVTNATFANDSTVYAAIVLKPDKVSGVPTYLDHYVYEATLPAPGAPVALDASLVTSSGITANWQPGPGVVPTSYVVELTSAADNFAPGTFVAANGATGQAAGVTTTGTSQAFANLAGATSYLYRVRASNSSGTSAVSNVISTMTVAGNAAPTLDAIPQPTPMRPSDIARTITLTGITAGGELGQVVNLSATSSNPAILPHPAIDYSAPATTAILTLDPTNAGSGSVTVTVTANDGQAENHTVVRTFVILIQDPPIQLGFEGDEELINVLSSPVNVTAQRLAGIGVGSPAGSGLAVQGTNGNVEKGAIVWRVQPYSGVSATDLHASIFFNPRMVDDLATKDKGELSIGFTGSLNVNSSKPQEFLRKTNPGISVKLNAEHDPTDLSKVRKLEAESTSWDGVTEAKGPKFTLLNAAEINHWLKVSVSAVRVGPESYAISYRVEDWGVDGTALVGVLIEGAPFVAENPAIANDAEIWSAFALAPEKNGVASLYLDQWETTVGTNPPVVPVATPAVQVTSESLLAKWTQGAGVFAAGWVVEVSTAADNFAPGTLINANGVGGQSTGIVIADGAIRQQRIENLLPTTAYVYRVRASNSFGTSGASNVVPVTTLADGENSAPTLDPIADTPALNINASQQAVALTGISAGGESDQFVGISATSSNPSLIPDPFIDYSAPLETGTLYFEPLAGQAGTAVITVTVADGIDTFQRTFTITVTEPQTLIGFNDASAMTRLEVSDFLGSTFTFGATAGIAGGGGAVFSRTGVLESTSVVYRPTAYDATVSPWLRSSIFLNVREVAAITSGKDKAELRFGFSTSNVPNATQPKDSLNKTHPAIGLAFKAEHEVGKADKDRKVEVELFSFNGTTESKSPKAGALHVAAMANWLKVNFLVVRAGPDQYYLTYSVEDWGVDGTAKQGEVFSGGPFLATNAPFFSDTSVYAGFSYSPEKTSTAQVYFDAYEVVVNTTSADAPIPLAASNVRAREFTAQWMAPLLGLTPSGYVLEVSKQSDAFAPGTLLNANGVGGQPNGITINNAGTTSLRITGLIPNTDYIYRVRAKRGSELSEVASLAFVGTLATDFVYWRETNFPGEAGNDAISGPDADPDADGVKNLMEYALGMNPNTSDVASLPEYAVSNGYLSITFLRRVNAPDVLYLPESSGSLHEEFGPDVTEVFASDPDVNGLQMVVVEDNVPVSSATARFMRLQLLSIP